MVGADFDIHPYSNPSVYSPLFPLSFLMTYALYLKLYRHVKFSKTREHFLQYKSIFVKLNDDKLYLVKI